MSEPTTWEEHASQLKARAEKAEAEVALIRELMSTEGCDHPERVANEILNLRVEVQRSKATVATLTAERDRLQIILGDGGLDIDARNEGASITAEKLKDIAETGEHHGVFGGADIEAAAQKILALRKDRDRLKGLALKYELDHGPKSREDHAQRVREIEGEK